MRTKRLKNPIHKHDRLTKPSPTAVRMHKGECHRWASKNRGIRLVEKKRIYKLAKISGMLGETLPQLADRVGVPRHILGAWMVKDPKIQRNLQRGMDVMVVEVERAAIKRACGYDEKRVSVATKRDVSGSIVEKTVTKQNIHIPGDPSMQRYLLDRRNKKRFAKEETAAAHIVLQIDGEDNML